MNQTKKISNSQIKNRTNNLDSTSTSQPEVSSWCNTLFSVGSSINLDPEHATLDHDPKSIAKKPVVHIVGIAGIGMSAMASILHSKGFIVRGSDLNLNNLAAKKLAEMGLQLFNDHKPQNIAGADIIVNSSAVASDNLELIAAREMGIPIWNRAELLAKMMTESTTINITGAHGKTTTTALVGHILTYSQLDPYILVGGMLGESNQNYRIGNSKYFVVEADESDGTFIKLPMSVGVITNIDVEHLDFYKGFDRLLEVYCDFINHTKAGETLVVCLDDKYLRSIVCCIDGWQTDERFLTFGISSFDTDISASNIDNHEDTYQSFDLHLAGRLANPPRVIKNLKIPMYGKHNVSNSLAAIAVALKLGVDIDVIIESLKHFTGVKRRFTEIGLVNQVTYIDDYAHHPTEIHAILDVANKRVEDRSTASQSKNQEAIPQTIIRTKNKIKKNGNVIAVVQPHRYTRLSTLFNDYVSALQLADHILVMDVYSAGEKPISGADSKFLVRCLQEEGARAQHTPSWDDVESSLPALINPGDYVIFMGAGDISKNANDYLDRLKIANKAQKDKPKISTEVAKDHKSSKRN